MSDEDMYREYERIINEAKLSAQSSNLAQEKQHIINEEREKGMLQEQLDVNEILDNIHNLLRGYVLYKNPQTNQTEWKEPDSDEMQILTDYGVNYIMGAVQWYLNKNTLLSNYDEETIWIKMEDFAITLADNLFMEYDKMFKHPTIEDVKDELKQRVENKVNLKKFTLEILGENIDKKKQEEIRKEILKEIEPRIEKELEVIKQQKMKNKLKRFESIIRFVQDTVHSAYLRAWRGQERTTLRQHISVNETKGGMIPQQMQQGSNLNPLNLFKR